MHACIHLAGGHPVVDGAACSILPRLHLSDILIHVAALLLCVAVISHVRLLNSLFFMNESIGDASVGVSRHFAAPGETSYKVLFLFFIDFLQKASERAISWRESLRLKPWRGLDYWESIHLWLIEGLWSRLGCLLLEIHHWLVLIGLQHVLNLSLSLFASISLLL